MSAAFSLLLAILAVHRLAHLVAQEDGPFDVFALLRARLGQGSWIGRGFHCVLCISFWLSLPAAIAAQAETQNLASLLLAWLGIAGGVLVLHKVLP